MIRLLTENNRLISLLVAFVLVGGLGALATLPVAEDPAITNRFALVLTPYPGASAERVEALVTEKLELSLRELPEIKEITSTSGNGMSSLMMELREDISEPELVWSEVRDQLADVAPELPEGSLPSRLLDDRGKAYTLLVALRGRGGEPVPRQVLQRYARELQSRLRAVVGTDVVNIDGAAAEEILVNVNSADAAAAGQTVESIAAALSRFDTKVSAGLMENTSSRVQVEVTGDLSTVDRVARVPLTGRGGQVLRVADIASVSRTLRSPDSVKVLRNGQEQLVVGARMLESHRIGSWHRSITASLDVFAGALPSNIELDVIFDQRIYTDERMNHLMGNVALGFLLILTVLFLTLGWRSAVLVAAALPLMMLFTFMMMNVMDVPINQMSVTGLVVALGITVDNAIVMVDDIAQRKRDGLPRSQAVIKALGHLWLPLFGSTATTVLAFLAIYFTPGGAGDFIADLAICVIFALVGSWLISHSVVAVLAGRVIRVARVARDGTGGDELGGGFGDSELGGGELNNTEHNGSGNWWTRGLQTPRLAAAFDSLLRGALRKPRRALCLIMLLPAAGFYGITTVPESFFPPVDRDMFSMEVHLPVRTSFEQTEQVVRAIDRDLQRRPGVESADWFIGKSAAPFYYNLIERKFGTQNYAHAMVKTASAARTEALVKQLERELPQRFPEAWILVRKLEQGPPVFDPVEIRVFGNDLAVLESLGEEIRLHLSTVPAVTGTTASLGQAMPTAVLQLREEILASTTYSPMDSTRTLRANLDGVVVGALLEDTEEVPVRVRVDAGERGRADSLASLNINMGNTTTTNAGEATATVFRPTPLQAIADLRLEPRIISIPHEDGRRLNTIGGFMQSGVLPDTVLKALQKKLQQANFRLPPGYELQVGGEAEERAHTIRNMMGQVPVIAVLLVVVLVLSFNSWRLCALIMSVALMSVGLGMLSLSLARFPFAFQVIIALLGLMGLAINGAIVILAELRATPRAMDGDIDGIVTAVTHCVRHITSTTLTTVGGFFPLLIGGGQFWPPFAVTMAGGTALVTVLSLFYVPVAFMLLTRRARFEVFELQPKLEGG